jgi:HNH endonuclease
MGLFWDDERKRPTPTQALKIQLYKRENGVCQVCNVKGEFYEMEVGHNRAHSRGGKQTLRNSILVHPWCNKSMQNLSLKEYRRSIGATTKEDETRAALKSLKLSALRFLAKKHHVSVKGRIEEGFLSDTRIPPSKSKFVNALAKVVSVDRIQAELSDMPVPKKRRKRRESSWW